MSKSKKEIAVLSWNICKKLFVIIAKGLFIILIDLFILALSILQAIIFPSRKRRKKQQEFDHFIHYHNKRYSFTSKSPYNDSDRFD